jgi:hypothetical protein
MRGSPIIQERHLAEAVRRKVITHDQAEGILAVARNSPSEGEQQAPDLGWIGALQGLLAAGLVVFAMVGVSDSDTLRRPVAALARSLLLAVPLLGAGLWLRRFRWAAIPSSVLTAGAAVPLWAFGAGVATLCGVGVDSTWKYALLYPYAVAWGMVLVTATSLVLWRTLRVGPSLGVASAAVVTGTVVTVERYCNAHGLWGWSTRTAAMAAMAAVGALLAGLAALGNRGRPDRADGAFWAALPALGALGISAAERVNRSAGEALVWTLAALGVGCLGFKLERRAWLLCSAAGVLFYPAFGFSEARAGTTVVWTVFGLSAAAVALGAHLLRRRALERWSQGLAGAHEEPRSVWW